MATTATTTLDQTQQTAADELIAVTGDKTIQRTWDLADAIVTATPTIDRMILAQIRQGAVDKAGHDEFWSVQRLRQMGQTAHRWPKPDRVADVALDAHMEAYRKLGSLNEARKVLLTVKKNNGGKVSIRELRAELGANGTTAQPPRIDKAGVDEVWRRIAGMKADLRKHLRTRLKPDAKVIVEFQTLFNELAAMVAALNTPATAPVEEVLEPVAPAVRRNRRKGL
jgi:hypothetical protein